MPRWLARVTRFPIGHRQRTGDGDTREDTTPHATSHSKGPQEEEDIVLEEATVRAVGPDMSWRAGSRGLGCNSLACKAMDAAASTQADRESGRAQGQDAKHRLNQGIPSHLAVAGDSLPRA
ncbi:hypothetical protein GCM10009715_21140 [Paeniglutamicibacter psychrophenolicus]